MSSSGDDVADASLSQPKKRRVQSQRACDRCRQKKVRCNGSQKPGRCSTCEAYDYECTYNEAAKKRGPSKRYVDSLEARLEKMEDLLRKAYPEGGSPDDSASNRETAHRARAHSADFITGPCPSGSAPMTTHSSPGVTEDFDTSDDYEPSELVQRKLGALCLHPMSNRFFGKSSGATLLQTALELKSEYAGEEPITPISFARKKDSWAMHPWEIASFQPRWPGYDYPPPDLLASLIDLYFYHVNVFIPLLHRPTLEAAVADGLQHRDAGFGGVLLLVCATASRFSDDERVLMHGTGAHWHSCGWQWFDQVQLTHRSILAAGCLCDLQIYALAVIFLHGCSPPHACWTTVGIGIRLALDVGAHRRKMYSATPNAEDELLKRAFWVLIVHDRWLSSVLGRPLCISEEDFDVEYPIECDDEYWDHPDPELNFKQPPGKLSAMAHFTSFLRLTAIHSHALKTIYATNKSRVMHGYGGEQWEQHVVADLDSQLNSWIDSIPEHLRWDPTREDRTFFLQSGSLYSCYYYVQIQIHRTFIPSVRKPSALSFPSLAICTNAARACSHLVDTIRTRNHEPMSPNFQVPAFVSGIVLLVGLWGAKRSGMKLDPAREMQDVHKCIQVMTEAEPRWHIAGRLRDLLLELSTISELPLPHDNPPAPPPYAQKRRAGDEGFAVHSSLADVPTPAASSATAPTPEYADPFVWDPSQSQRPVAGSRRAMQASFTHATHPHTHPQRDPESLQDTAGYTYLPAQNPPLGTTAPLLAPQHPPARAQPPPPPPPISTAPFQPQRFPPAPPGSSHQNGPQFGTRFGTQFDGAEGGGGGAFAYDMGVGAASTEDTLSSTDAGAGAGAFFTPAGANGGFAPDGLGDTTTFERMLQGLAQDADGQLGVDRDTMMMWSMLPDSIEDWDSYISTATGWTHPHAHAHPDPGAPR